MLLEVANGVEVVNIEKDAALWGEESPGVGHSDQLRGLD